MSLVRNFIYKSESIDKGYVNSYYCIQPGHKINVHFMEDGIAKSCNCKVQDIKKEKIFDDVIENIYLEDL